MIKLRVKLFTIIKNSFGIKYVKTKAGKFWCEQHQEWETEQSHNQPPSGVGT